ncbi:MAG: hypothetical protein WD080_03775 [Egibacteraceae bacterium]
MGSICLSPGGPGNFRYEAHHYFDHNRSSWYDHTDDEEVADAVAKGY